MKYIEKECKRHGTCKYVLEGRGAYRCTKCRSDSVGKRRKKLKASLVEYKGGKCERCGYNKCVEALDFHHLDPSIKEYGLSHKGLTRSLEKLKEEADKCILVCANCHREIHADIAL